MMEPQPVDVTASAHDALREWRKSRGYCPDCGACGSEECCSPCVCEVDE